MSREQRCGSLWSVVGSQKNASRLLFSKNLECCFYKIILAANNKKKRLSKLVSVKKIVEQNEFPFGQ